MSKYAFEGEKIKINDKDYNKMRFLYPNLNLVIELSQLDMELRQKKDWWMAMHAKLRYRNSKNIGAGYEQRKPSLAERSFAATEQVFRKFDNYGDSALESNDNIVRIQMD